MYAQHDFFLNVSLNLLVKSIACWNIPSNSKYEKGEYKNFELLKKSESNTGMVVEETIGDVVLAQESTLPLSWSLKVHEWTRMDTKLQAKHFFSKLPSVQLALSDQNVSSQKQIEGEPFIFIHKKDYCKMPEPYRKVMLSKNIVKYSRLLNIVLLYWYN